MNTLYKKLFTNEFKINKLLLRFEDKQIQHKYHESQVDAFVKNGRVALIISVVIYMLFSISDYFIINDIFWYAVLARVIIGMLLGLGSFIASFYNFFNKLGDKIIGITVLTAGYSILLMIMYSNTIYKSYYFFGFYIVVLVANVFFRQSFINCLVGSLLFIIGFEITIMNANISPYLIILNHLYFYSTLIMLIVNSYSTEYHRLYEFFLKLEVEDKNDLLINSNIELDRKIEEKTKELKVSYSKEKKANELQQIFLKNMSHHTRTPLNSIIGLSSLLLHKDDISQECKTDLSQIHDSGAELLDLIEEISLHSKTETDSFKLNYTNFDLSSVLKNVQHYFKNINKKKIDLRIENDGSKKIFIVSDYDKIALLLKKLVLQAYKRMDYGKITINYVTEINSGVNIIIKDNGQAIDSEIIHKALSSNINFSNEIANPQSFTYSLLNKLGQVIGSGLKIDNDQAYGNIISFKISSSVEIVDTLPKAKEANPDLQLKDIKILVAEDIKFNYIIIKKMLDKQGAIVERAVDGLEAVEKASMFIYDAILMDIQMPKMSGIDATKEIRALGIVTPIIAQTANILAEDKGICINAGCDDYIGKPINQFELIESIKRHL